ncbi:hypothetical protein QCA50_009047 [Cerrena zonata]|uniref:Uncharacterized protein n=1 Tax=Cerrena zonata TaxID=2478898 RepID=A0AAW0GD04_9APHY
MQTGTVFKRISAEEWKDPSYAYTRSISPMVAFRALQCHCFINATTASVVDPPIIIGGILDFATRPAEFVRFMVTESETYIQKREETILAMGTESTSEHLSLSSDQDRALPSSN